MSVETKIKADNEPPVVQAERWLDEFGAALRSGDEPALRDLFDKNGTWRDLLVFRWDFHNHIGADAVAAALASSSGSGAGDLEVSRRQSPRHQVHGEQEQIETWFEFTTNKGSAWGFVRLARVEPDQWKALQLLTQLDQLADSPERIGVNRPVGAHQTSGSERENWAVARERECDFLDEDPAVVVVGGGHCGLAIAARLGALDVPALVVERNPRIGDNWRNRYPSLALHFPSSLDHMPYMPYPARWTRYTPKDKFAGWLEMYAEALELNVWTGSEITGTAYHAAEQRWDVTIRRADGSERVVHPRHVVMATGLNGKPKMPELVGSDEFAGPVVHSSEFGGGAEWQGKNAVVIGSAVSAHDIARDLYENGAKVTMLQRNPTYVVNVESFYQVYIPDFVEPTTLPIECGDMIFGATPFRLIPEAGKQATAVLAEMDRKTLEGLNRAGFRTELGPDGGGMYANHLNGRDSYYLNNGVSELIIDGKIDVRSGLEVDKLQADGVVLTDGSFLPADVVVAATGYGKILEAARDVVGDVVDNCDPVYQISEDGEMGGAWRRSGQDGLWFMTGVLQGSRYYSKYLALQIKAIEDGLMPYVAPAEATAVV